MKCVIAEKPSVARDIAALLGATKQEDGCLVGNGYMVTWAIGHLVQLADSKAYGYEAWSLENLPIIPENFKYAVSKDKIKQFNIVKKAFAESDEIIVATDAGREGELIFRYIYLLSGSKKPFKRLWISSLTDEAITNGFKNLKPGSDYDNEYHSARSRSEADWLVGINATQTITLSSQAESVISLGRVQTPTLAMICNRYLENTTFEKKPFWKIQIEVETASKNKFSAKYIGELNSEELAKSTLAKISTQLLVSKYTTKEVKEAAPKLFDLSSLQQECNKKFGLTADQTLQVAQNLYESKAITYPRTGSQYLSDDMKSEVKEVINFLKKGQLEIVATKVANLELSNLPFNNAKVTDHHAIIPTQKGLQNLKGNEVKVYELIAKRFLAAFSNVCVKDTTSIELIDSKDSNLVFTANGYTIKSQGWREIFLNDTSEEKEDNEQKEDQQQLPILNENENLNLIKKDFDKAFTKPKPLLNDSSLLKLMETAGKDIEDEELRETLKDIGIGTPATRASIITTLESRDYVYREKKNIIPTSRGLEIYDLVKDMPIAQVEMTGQWEHKLNQIAKGTLKRNLFISEIQDYTKEIVSVLKNSDFKILKEECPCCRKDTLSIAKSYVKCRNTDCGFSFSKTIAKKKISDEDVLSIIKNGRSNLIKGFKSKEDKSFEACIKLNIEEKKISFFFEDTFKDSKIKCPKCKGESLISNSKAISCTNKESCGFVIFKTISNKLISDKTMINLISNGITGEIKGFKSKEGKEFNAALKLKSDFSGCEFVFSKK